MRSHYDACKTVSFYIVSEGFLFGVAVCSCAVVRKCLYTMSAFLGTIFTAAKKTNSIFTTTMLGALTNIAFNLR
jgi:hypothetical protein